MANIIRIDQLELAINRCKLVQPVRDYVLSADLRLFAHVYASMIFFHETTLDVECQPENVKRLILSWLENIG